MKRKRYSLTSHHLPLTSISGAMLDMRNLYERTKVAWFFVQGYLFVFATKVSKRRHCSNGFVEQNQWNRSTKPMESVSNINGLVQFIWRIMKERWQIKAIYLAVFFEHFLWVCRLSTEMSDEHHKRRSPALSFRKTRDSLFVWNKCFLFRPQLQLELLKRCSCCCGLS